VIFYENRDIPISSAKIILYSISTKYGDEVRKSEVSTIPEREEFL